MFFPNNLFFWFVPGEYLRAESYQIVLPYAFLFCGTSIDFRFLNSNVFTGKFPSISSSFFLNGMAMIAVL